MQSDRARRRQRRHCSGLQARSRLWQQKAPHQRSLLSLLIGGWRRSRVHPLAFATRVGQLMRAFALKVKSDHNSIGSRFQPVEPFCQPWELRLSLAADQPKRSHGSRWVFALVRGAPALPERDVFSPRTAVRASHSSSRSKQEQQQQQHRQQQQDDEEQEQVGVVAGGSSKRARPG
jgi:hypothetical protein